MELEGTILNEITREHTYYMISLIQGILKKKQFKLIETDLLTLAKSHYLSLFIYNIAIIV